MGCGCNKSPVNNTPSHNCGHGCGHGSSAGNGPCHSIQPDMVRMTRNVNAPCTPSCSRTAKTCTRREWLRGIDCSGMDFNLDNAELGVEQGAIVRLPAVYKNAAGHPVDPIEPRITIKGPCGKIFLSNQPMTRQNAGRYFFLFGTDGRTDLGIWTADVVGVIDGVRVDDEYFFAVLPIGSIPFNNCCDGYGPDGYGCDGYGDGYGCYGPCEKGIESGADGYGTFAGREECGFDGCKSKDIPATGGCRTNRNPEGGGDGFWDGISYESSCVTPIGKRGMCMKDRAVAMTRVRLKDIEPKCITGDTIVTTQLGHKRIDEVKEGDLLWVYDGETKQYSYQPVRELIVNGTKTGEIVTIKTKRGRRLRCTPSHKIVTDTGPVEAKDCKVGMKTMVNPLAAVDSVIFDPEQVFFTYEQFEKMFPETREITKEEVKRWFPIKGLNAVVFARLAGFIFGDGHLRKDLSGVTFASDCVGELEAIQRDINIFNIASNNNIKTRIGEVAAQSVSGYKKKCSGVTTYFDLTSTAFAKTLYLLGVPKGDKATQEYFIPDWIFNNKWLLKNFLSAYYGADGCDVINSTGIREINFSFNKDKKINVEDLIKQWKQAFATFDIPLRHREEPNSGAVRKKDGKITTKWVLVPECSEAEGIIKFAEQIGCCYHTEKAHNLAVASEYLREVEVFKKKNDMERQRIFECLKGGLSRTETVEELYPAATEKERVVLWNKCDRWIRGSKEAIESIVNSTQKRNEAQQTIYKYVVNSNQTLSHGEVARDVIQRFKSEFEICGLTTSYKSVWVLVKSWRNGRIPDSERYSYTTEDFIESSTNQVSTEAGIDYTICNFDDWKKQYIAGNRYYDEIVDIEVERSEENVYDCKFDKLYLLAESIVILDCWAFSEDEIDLQLELSLSDFNAWPTFTCFTWDTLPENFLGVVTLGAQVFALVAQGLLESGREFQITDNGINYNSPAISGYMQTSASMLLASYTEMKEKIKSNMKPSPAGIGTFRVMSMLPGLMRLRHLRSKQII